MFQTTNQIKVPHKLIQTARFRSPPRTRQHHALLSRVSSLMKLTPRPGGREVGNNLADGALAMM